MKALLDEPTDDADVRHHETAKPAGNTRNDKTNRPRRASWKRTAKEGNQRQNKEDSNGGSTQPK